MTTSQIRSSEQAFRLSADCAWASLVNQPAKPVMGGLYLENHQTGR